MISFTLRGRLDAFYDRLRLPKGPSFGMRTTLICPFMYLAHYDLVTTEKGREELTRLVEPPRGAIRPEVDRRLFIGQGQRTH